MESGKEKEIRDAEHAKNLLEDPLLQETLDKWRKNILLLGGILKQKNQRPGNYYGNYYGQ